jgi:erythronate-4-phosphate dehydrogenase
MRIAVDENVPGAHEAFGQFGDVVPFAGRTLRRSELAGIDALVVRSVTRVDAALLDDTPVRFVGTATIGTDHLDLDYLRSRRIATADAAGCNSRSVAEYVLAALLELDERGSVDIARDTLGVVGVGRIGAIVAHVARALGMPVVEHDPPRARRDRSFRSAAASDLFNCRVVTVHVPLTVGCADPTWHMIDAAFLERMRPDAILINTSRGTVAHSGDLHAALRRRLLSSAVLDVWEGEPSVPVELIRRTALATPHIAGYSLDGKARGTAMIADALGAWCGIASQWREESIAPALVGTISIDGELSPLDAARAAVRQVYDIRSDDEALRALLEHSDDERRRGFDEFRRAYPVRRENAGYAIIGGSERSRSLLEGIGFRIGEQLSY